jgi:Secretion system C-terminal sorting domain
MKIKIIILIMLISIFALELSAQPIPPSSLVGYSKVGEGDTPLPVTLSEFDGIFIISSVELNWSTASESENMGFNIYRTLNSEKELLATYQNNDALLGQGTISRTSVYSYTDTKVRNGVSYTYTLADVKLDGSETVHEGMAISVKIPQNGSIVAEDFTLEPVYPNPFNPSFTIPFTLNSNMNVSFNLYDLMGHRVMLILEEQLPAGSYQQIVTPETISSGIYILRSKIGSTRNTQKIVLMK